MKTPFDKGKADKKKKKEKVNFSSSEKRKSVKFVSNLSENVQQIYPKTPHAKKRKLDSTLENEETSEVLVKSVKKDDNQEQKTWNSSKSVKKRQKNKMKDSGSKNELVIGQRKLEFDGDGQSEKSDGNDDSVSMQNEKEEKKEKVEKEGSVVFVGNVPLTFDKRKIVKIFSKFGKVNKARLRCIPVANVKTPKKVAAIKKEFHANRKSCVAYVEFDSKSSALNAIKANGMIVDGHHLRVDSLETNTRNLQHSVFVGGLPADVEDDDLWSLFEKCGKIEDVRVIRDNFGVGKGFGYVNFDSIASVELALKLKGEKIKTSQINVERCKKFKKKEKSKKKTNAGVDKSKQIQDKNGGFQGKKAQLKNKKKKKINKANQKKKKMAKVFSKSNTKSEN